MAKKRKPKPAEPAPLDLATLSYPPRRPKSEVLYGAPVLMADGNQWHLFPGYFLAALDPIRDRLFDLWAAGRPFAVDDVLQAASTLLRLNYDLDFDEAKLLVYGTIGREETGPGLATAVLHSLVIDFTQRWTYSEWQRTAFLLAGVETANLPPDMIPAMLAHLIAAGRVAPPSKFVGSLVFLEYRDGLLKANKPQTSLPPGMPA